MLNHWHYRQIKTKWGKENAEKDITKNENSRLLYEFTV